ncbi:MAG: hypothetical protein KBS35_00125 [Mycoplasma sp.]|nr:hypothetical protein [Candidatus Hennigella equi]
MAKKSFWIKGSTIRTMTTKQLEQYEFNVRSVNPDELSDHELLLLLVKRMDNLEKLVLDIIKLNNLKIK